MLLQDNFIIVIVFMSIVHVDNFLRALILLLFSTKYSAFFTEDKGKFGLCLTYATTIFWWENTSINWAWPNTLATLLCSMWSMRPKPQDRKNPISWISPIRTLWLTRPESSMSLMWPKRLLMSLMSLWWPMTPLMSLMRLWWPIRP